MANSGSVSQLAGDFLRRLPGSYRRISIQPDLAAVDQPSGKVSLNKLRTVWLLSKNRAASMFGVTRASYMAWEEADVSKERRIVLNVLNQVTDLLSSHIDQELIPAIVRWRCKALGEKSLIELAEEGRYDELLNAATRICDGSAGDVEEAFAIPEDLAELIATVEQGNFVRPRSSEVGVQGNVVRHPSFSYGVRYKPELRKKVVELVHAGHRVSELAKIIGCSRVIVRLWVNEANRSQEEHLVSPDLVDLVAIIKRRDFVLPRPCEAGMQTIEFSHLQDVGVRYKRQFREKVVALFRSGHSVPKLARIVGCSSNTIRAWTKQYN